MHTEDGPPVDPRTLVVLAGAAANRERLRFAYRSADGTETRRLTEPYRLVTAGRRWYLLAYDNDRDDWRRFRVDLRALGARAIRAAQASTWKHPP
ncbi:helix-turn-helix transcriptional regulator [Streptosporangium saharense]|uniref:helix-turn-helix transcriptional regulator n=1 Tax=Streptosporangium saharense TaxID=1706840 RepID=UPI003EBE1228